MTFTELVKHPNVKGICIGNCPAGDELGKACKRTVAHAHSVPGHKYSGWICLHQHRDLNKTTLAHEIAHLVVGHRTHNERWRRTMRQLGGRVEAQYQPSSK